MKTDTKTFWHGDLKVPEDDQAAPSMGFLKNAQQPPSPGHLPSGVPAAGWVHPAPLWDNGSLPAQPRKGWGAPL